MLYNGILHTNSHIINVKFYDVINNFNVMSSFIDITVIISRPISNLPLYPLQIYLNSMVINILQHAKQVIATSMCESYITNDYDDCIALN